ncbi:BQ2448_5182 [Microbotryum intermedium]|uniref:BQ2448_5182 protein n=1 Tax=Microbotryum intermedium TaxID=269621 RepID=A0A238F6B1_9BASI|nr:BQ2448_5182 [Microbotryum intermedium]
MAEPFLESDVPTPFLGATDESFDFPILSQSHASAPTSAPAAAPAHASTLEARADPHHDHDDNDAEVSHDHHHHRDLECALDLDTTQNSSKLPPLAHPEQSNSATAPSIDHNLVPDPSRPEELLRPKVDLLEAHSDIFTGSTLSPIPSTPAATAENSDAGPATTSSLKRRASNELPLPMHEDAHAHTLPALTSAAGASLPLELEPTTDEVEHSPMHRAAKSASQWNSLLRWARHQRGPQWDYATSQYHVDRSTPEFYAGVERSAVHPSALPSHLSHNASGAASPAFSGPGTPAHEVAGVYDSGRPRRTRAGAR